VRNIELEAQIWSRNEPNAEDFERFFDDISARNTEIYQNPE
jgi:hypothetical protein